MNPFEEKENELQRMKDDLLREKIKTLKDSEEFKKASPIMQTEFLLGVQLRNLLDL